MDSTNKKDISQTAENALRILDCFIEKEECGISELSRELELGKASVSRLVAALERKKFLMQDKSTGKYRLGVRLMLFGSLYTERNELSRYFSAPMREIAEKYQSTSHLSAYLGNEIHIVNKVACGPLVYMTSRIGGTMSAASSATGKSVLAFLPKDKVEILLSKENFEALTEHSITDRETYLSELQKVKIQGYSVDDEESYLGLYCISVPVFNMCGELIAALSLSGSKRLLYERTKEIVADLKNIANSFSL